MSENFCFKKLGQNMIKKNKNHQAFAFVFRPVGRPKRISESPEHEAKQIQKNRQTFSEVTPVKWVEGTSSTKGL